MTNPVRRFMRPALSACILLSLFLSSAEAAIYTWNFNSASGYTYNAGQIEFVDGVARLRKTNIVHNDNSEREFGGGVLNGLSWDSTNNKLTLNTGASEGSIVSQVIDSFESPHTWNLLSWIPEQAYTKRLPNSRGSESGYTTNYYNQYGVAQYHFDEANGSTSFANSATGGNTATCTTNCPTTTTNGFYQGGLSLDGTQSLEVADPGSSTLDLPGYRTVEFLYKPPTEEFSYRRQITLAAPTTVANTTYKLTLTPANFDYSKVQADGDDIRFFTDTNHGLHYWIERWNPGGESVIWVEVMEAGTSSFFMYYGNPTVGSTSSGLDTFEHFTDFDREGLDRLRWTIGETPLTGPLTGKSLFANNGKLINESITESNGAFTGLRPLDRQRQDALEFRAIVELKAIGNAAAVTPKYVAELNEKVNNTRVRFEWFGAGNTSGLDYRIQFGSGTSNLVTVASASNQGKHMPIGVPYELVLKRQYIDGTNNRATVEVRPVIEGAGPSWTETVTGTFGFNNQSLYSATFGIGTDAEVWTDRAAIRIYNPQGDTTTVGTEESVSKSFAYNEGFLFERPVQLSSPTSQNNMVLELILTGDNSYKRMHPNGNDIRFVDPSGNNVPYFIEAIGTTTIIWVKVPEAGTSNLTMLYGNPYLAPVSDPGIFDFYENFSYIDPATNKPVLDPDTWEVIDHSGPANQSNIGIRREALHNLGQNLSDRFTIKSKESLSGTKALRIRYQRGDLNLSTAFCYGYGSNAPDGHLTSMGNALLRQIRPGLNPVDHIIRNVESSMTGLSCPQKTTDFALTTGVDVPNSAGSDPVYYWVEDLKMSATLGTTRSIRSMYYDNIQSPTDTVAASETGPTSGNIFMTFRGNAPTRVSYIFARPYVDNEPTLSIGAERMSGIGKPESYGIGMVRGVMFSTTTNTSSGSTGTDRLHGGYLDEGWNYVVQNPNGSSSYGVEGDRLFINGKMVSIVEYKTALNNDRPFVIGGDTLVAPRLPGVIDELAVSSWFTPITTGFRRHFGDIQFQLRSCDTADCSDGGAFIGPDGTSNSFWNESDHTALTTPSKTLSSIASKRYLQYQARFVAKRPGITPSLLSMTLGQGVAFTTKPTIVFQTGTNQYYTLENAALTLGGKNVGNVRFQLGANYTTAPTGTRWHYWNGSNWVLANTTANVAETNTIEELNEAISFFPGMRSAGTVNPRYLYVRAFLDSEEGEPVEIDNLALSYYNTDTAPGAPEDLFANDTLEGAQTGSASPVSLDGLSAVVSARYVDPDIADVAYKYILQVARDSNFTDIVYDTETVAAGGITMPPLRNGQRSQNLPIPDGLIEYNTTYYWRVAFKDGVGRQSSYATAQFVSPDTDAPQILIAPADGLSAIARNSNITVQVTDDKLGVDADSITISVGGVSAFSSNTCETGFVCSIDPITDGYEIVITPDSLFTYNQSVAVSVSASDGANNATATSTFTTIPNGAPDMPEDLFANTEATGASTGEINPERLDIGALGNNIALSARFIDTDADDEGTAYRLEIARNNTFSNESLIFTTDTTSPSGVSIAQPLQDGDRISDILVSTGAMELETTYYWRIQFQDAYGNWSPFSPTGASSARFSLADTEAPLIQDIEPANNATDVARNSSISFVVEDEGSGIDMTSLQTAISGQDAVVDGVCQTGFFCNFTPVDPLNFELGYTVTVTPDTIFPSLTSIALDIEVSDNAGVPNTSSVSTTFMTAPVAPAAPSDLLAGTVTIPASSNPDNLDSTRVLLSALFEDEDTGDQAVSYEIEVSTDDVFSNVIYSSTDTFTTPVANGERTPDIAIPENILEIEKEYFWRIRLIDSHGLTSTYSASGNDAATFMIIDTIAPVLDPAGSLPDNTTLANKDTIVMLTLSDNLPVKQNLLNVTLDGQKVVENGVCLTGFTCGVTVNGTEVEISVLPAGGFAVGNRVIEVTLGDGRQSTTVTRAFTVPAPQPTSPTTGSVPTPDRVQTPPPAPKPTPSPAPEQSTPRPAAETTVVPPRPVSVVETVVKLLTDRNAAEAAIEQIAQSIPTAGGGDSSTRGNVLSEILALVVGNPPVNTLKPAASEPGNIVGPKENPPRHTEVNFDDSLCFELKTRHNYSVGSEVAETLRAQINTLKNTGVDFSNGGKDLSLSSQVTRSELLRYLLQANCDIFDRDISMVEKFPDVPESHPDYIYVMLARKYKYVSGYLHDGLFRPDRPIDRAESLKIILEVFTEGRITKTLTYPMYFLDIRPEDWFRGYVVAGTLAQIVDTSNSTFRPYDQLTLEEIVLLLARSLNIRVE